MRTIFRNASNRVLLKLRDDPAALAYAVLLFRQNGRPVLTKGKEALSVRPGTDSRGQPFWELSAELSPAEAALFDGRGLVFAQLAVLRESGRQDCGEIVEFDVCDTAAEIRFDPPRGKAWKNESWRAET